jgi:hypothetical protein
MMDMQKETAKLIAKETEPLRRAAQNVIDTWESGDLAKAVRELDAALRGQQ